jgi:hypothetical protein
MEKINAGCYFKLSGGNWQYESTNSSAWTLAPFYAARDHDELWIGDHLTRCPSDLCQSSRMVTRAVRANNHWVNGPQLEFLYHIIMQNQWVERNDELLTLLLNRKPMISRLYGHAFECELVRSLIRSLIITPTQFC